MSMTEQKEAMHLFIGGRLQADVESGTQKILFVNTFHSYETSWTKVLWHATSSSSNDLPYLLEFKINNL